MTLRTVLLSLQALLAAAEPDDPQDAVVANQVCAHVLVYTLKFTEKICCSFFKLSSMFIVLSCDPGYLLEFWL